MYFIPLARDELEVVVLGVWEPGSVACRRAEEFFDKKTTNAVVCKIEERKKKNERTYTSYNVK